MLYVDVLFDWQKQHLVVTFCVNCTVFFLIVYSDPLPIRAVLTVSSPVPS